MTFSPIDIAPLARMNSKDLIRPCSKIFSKVGVKSKGAVNNSPSNLQISYNLQIRIETKEKIDFKERNLLFREKKQSGGPLQ